MQKEVINQYNNKLEEQLIKLFHSSDLPLHFNKTGNKEFTNYQRVSIIILFQRSKKSLRDFVVEFNESKWISYLGLKKVPKKSTLHDWLTIFDMKIIRKMCKVLLPNEITLTSIDGTGFDSWQRSRHYEKRAGETHIPHMPYAKADLFIDVKTQIILDYNFITYREHDVIGAERIFKRNDIKNIIGLGDKGYDSENLHKIARENGIIFYAPTRKRDKRSLKEKPKGKHRRECVDLPEFYGMRWINETINSVLKRTQIHFLRSKKSYMKKREFGWQVILYNIKRKIKLSDKKEVQTYFCLIIILCPFRTEHFPHNIYIILTIVNLMTKNTVLEISREVYDNANVENLKFKSEVGINEEVVRNISKSKNEPEWMLQKRLNALKIFFDKQLPTFGPSLADLDLNEIHYFLQPDAKKNATSWDDVPQDIKLTYEKLGIPQAERDALAGVGAQYESEIVYHKLKKELEDLGVVFLDMDEAVIQYPNLVKKYFMTNCVPVGLHKFSALHASVWSGGTFIYVPKNVKVTQPLQAYFRMNARKGGQFEHTLIIADEDSVLHYIEGCSAPSYTENSLHAGCVEIHVLKNARVRYSSIENWSKNTYNLNTKRAVVHENAVMEWVNGNMGSKVTMLYPCSVLIGKNAKTDYLGIAFAGAGQYQDTGCKVYHFNSNTSSKIISKGISKDGGISSYRGLVHIKAGSINSKSHVSCDGLMLDNISTSSTLPSMEVKENDVKVSHEATIGKVGEDQLFYLMSRGLSESQATKMIVSGFIEPIVKELPLEYAVELNRLIELEIENSVC
ncbi:Fe-S cluster assembly protein SufB [Candidatus Pacearchaeota archaeon CG10_big_fil_rev_8_21_14_0_10_32_14]|nr:MAG: Fe-S cluster assembly protein SufB [Candidatus Pacearchaeota archaeon CG10_big_fil_rev_8_21_14_0_10_32_14]